MGYGEFGSNGSMYWRIGYDDAARVPADHMDYDTIKPLRIGKGSTGLKTHPRHLRVRLRFRDLQAARKAWERAISSGGPLEGATGYYVAIDVLAVKRRSPRQHPAWEVRVDW